MMRTFFVPKRQQCFLGWLLQQELWNKVQRDLTSGTQAAGAGSPGASRPSLALPQGWGSYGILL